MRDGRERVNDSCPEQYCYRSKDQPEIKKTQNATAAVNITSIAMASAFESSLCIVTDASVVSSKLFGPSRPSWCPSLI